MVGKKTGIELNATLQLKNISWIQRSAKLLDDWENPEFLTAMR